MLCCRACRGGVPICFPQFGMLGPLKAQHGFARTSRWGVVEQKPSSITLRLEPTPELVALWPYAFELEMTVEGGQGCLGMTSYCLGGEVDTTRLPWACPGDWQGAMPTMPSNAP